MLILTTSSQHITFSKYEASVGIDSHSNNDNLRCCLASSLTPSKKLYICCIRVYKLLICRKDIKSMGIFQDFIFKIVIKWMFSIKKAPRFTTKDFLPLLFSFYLFYIGRRPTDSAASSRHRLTELVAHDLACLSHILP